MGPSPTMRTASVADLPAVVALLADDPLGATREVGDLEPYRAAFEEIEADPAHRLVVAELDGAVVGVLQVSVLPCLTHGGRRRAQLEGVRVAASVRGAGVGRALVAWALDLARRDGCGVAQLTTDVRRPDARRFYESLGFEATHHGMKLEL